MMVGNAAEASIARAEVRAYEGSHFNVQTQMRLPEGWEVLGYGCFRVALLAPSGAVYKVQWRPGRQGQTNRDEFDNALRVLTECRAPERTRIPAFTLYADPDPLGGDDVIAMERVHGVTLDEFEDGTEDTDDPVATEYRRLMWKCEDAFGLVDLHTENVMIDSRTGYLVVVDLGY